MITAVRVRLIVQMLTEMAEAVPQLRPDLAMINKWLLEASVVDVSVKHDREAA